MMPMDDESRLRPCREALADWFANAARVLPWRENRDPYRIWISEIMLQQTQVQQVIPYYARFLAQFPDVAALAAAPLDAVLKAWEGMGYYARARHLHRAAAEICRQHGGLFPRDPEAVRRLPGIGPYTAAAILSIAFGEPLAVVDGNVVRLLSRFSAVAEESGSTAARKKIAALADALLDRQRPGDHNEAMMELGATVCTPRSPLCAVCPLAFACAAHAAGEEERYPVKARAKARPHVQIAAAMIWREGELLITRRREEGLLGGLWEFPGGKQEEGESLEQTVEREVAEEVGVRVRVRGHFMSVDHAYSHFSITLHIFDAEWLGGEPRCLECSDWRWVTPARLRDYAFPRANLKIIDQLLAGMGLEGGEDAAAAPGPMAENRAAERGSKGRGRRRDYRP